MRFSFQNILTEIGDFSNVKMCPFAYESILNTEKNNQGSKIEPDVLFHVRRWSS
jgi:hypothetical protein